MLMPENNAASDIPFQNGFTLAKQSIRVCHVVGFVQYGS